VRHYLLWRAVHEMQSDCAELRRIVPEPLDNRTCRTKTSANNDFMFLCQCWSFENSKCNTTKKASFPVQISHVRAFHTILSLHINIRIRRAQQFALFFFPDSIICSAIPSNLHALYFAFEPPSNQLLSPSQLYSNTAWDFIRLFSLW